MELQALELQTFELQTLELQTFALQTFALQIFALQTFELQTLELQRARGPIWLAAVRSDGCRSRIAARAGTNMACSRPIGRLQVTDCSARRNQYGMQPSDRTAAAQASQF